MPIADDILRDYQRLLAGEGFVDLSDRSKIELRGKDRVSLLHNFCTNDIKRLSVGQQCEAFVCNAKGHILGHIHVFCGQDVLRIDSVAGDGAKLATHFDRYVIREDVQVIDCTDQYRAVLLCGSNPDEAVTSFSLDLAPQAQLSWVPLNIPPPRLTECSREALEIVRIEQGYPLYGVDFTVDNLPQEIGRDEQTLSFTKGCYLGQETVARLASLGHVNQSLCQLSFSGNDVPPVGAELSSNGKVVGRITSSCWSPKYGRPIALAFVRRGFNAPRSTVQWSGGEGQVGVTST